jgi:hypothetical protein
MRSLLASTAGRAPHGFTREPARCERYFTVFGRFDDALAARISNCMAASTSSNASAHACCLRGEVSSLMPV